MALYYLFVNIKSFSSQLYPLIKVNKELRLLVELNNTFYDDKRLS